MYLFLNIKKSSIYFKNKIFLKYSLLDLKYVGLTRAKQLFANDYKTLENIASAKASDLCRKIDNLPLLTSAKIVTSAKVSNII